MQNNKIIVIGLALILSSVLSYSIFGSNQEQQTEIGVIETVKEFDLSIVERKLTLDPPIISVNVGDKILLRIQSDLSLIHI